MTNYFDNNTNAEWHVTDDKVEIQVEHDDHTHTLDITDVDAHELADNPGQVLGDAHRASGHDKK